MPGRKKLNILGLNGLGIMPAACLIADGRLIAFAEEERFTRQKGSIGLMPGKATKYCLQEAGLSLGDIDYIAFGWDANMYIYKMPLFLAYRSLTRPVKSSGGKLARVWNEMKKYNPVSVSRQIREMMIRENIPGKLPPVRFIPHHLAHAASAFYASGMEEAYIMVVDGSGENKCTTIYRGNGLDIETVKTFSIPDSLGWFYQSITDFLGFSPNNHEGKVMALAAYGEPDQDIYTKLRKMLSFDDLGNYRYDSRYSFGGTQVPGRIFSKEMTEILGAPRETGDVLSDFHKNLAFATQDILELVCTNMARDISTYKDFKGNLCISGGVGLNCKMNGGIAGLDHISQVFVPPHCSDAGTALGAAMQLSAEQGRDPRFRMEHAYWGPGFSREEILDALQRNGQEYEEPENICQATANLLAEDKVIAWFQGRMEVGPRALGNRSILANPGSSAMRDHINQNIKDRETWRPFAASIAEEYKGRYLKNTSDSPFMTLAFPVTGEMREKAVSAIHIDMTTRPQIISKTANEKYWQLITEFGKITGVYALLNTSFNMREEPIVCSPDDAIRSFIASGTDFLAIGDFLVKNRNVTGENTGMRQ